VLEEMFGEKQYKPLALAEVQKTLIGKKVSILGRILGYGLGDILEICFGSDNGETVTSTYSSQMGISGKELRDICEKVYDDNIEARIYGEIIDEPGNSDYKAVLVHKIEFEEQGVKQEFPNAKHIYDIQENFSNIDDFIEFQRHEKQVVAALNNAVSEIERENALKQRAQLEFYKSFSDYSGKMEQKLRDESSELVFIEPDATEIDLEPRL